MYIWLDMAAVHVKIAESTRAPFRDIVNDFRNECCGSARNSKPRSSPVSSPRTGH